MSVYKLYSAGSGGTQDNLASIDIQFDGVITAIVGTAYGDFDAADENLRVEVSFLSTNTVISNDSRGSLFTMQSALGIVTSGSHPGMQNSVSGINVDVTAGERVHLHIVSTSGVVSQATVYLYVTDGSPAALRRRR